MPNLSQLRRLSCFWTLPYDFVRHLQSESHQGVHATHTGLRMLYRLSRGRSRSAFRALFQKVRPAPANANPEPALISELREEGIAVVRQFLDESAVAELRHHFAVTPGVVVGGPSDGEVCTIEEHRGLKLQFSAVSVLELPEAQALVASSVLRDLAAAYFGSAPVFTGVTAWWTTADSAASVEELSEAAQLYHFDYDWPLFLKFFVYLTDVGETNGPFTYVRGTHEAKTSWADGRFDDAEIHSSYGEAEFAVTGNAGDLIIADTAGFHKGMPVTGEPRLLLQLEYAVSRLGASYQYPLLPAELKPSTAPDPTYAVFAL